MKEYLPLGVCTQQIDLRLCKPYNLFQLSVFWKLRKDRPIQLVPDQGLRFYDQGDDSSDSGIESVLG